jgi:hypothetical protein
MAMIFGLLGFLCVEKGNVRNIFPLRRILLKFIELIVKIVSRGKEKWL